MFDFLNIVRLLASGAVNTLLITLCSMLFGLIGGLLLTVAHAMAGKYVRIILRCTVYSIQSVPPLVVIFMAMYGLPQLGIITPPFLTVVTCLGTIAAAYICEVLRGALNSIGSIQMEAGLALGMSKTRVFISILMPQMWRLAVPGLINEFTAVLKSSPFAYIAGVPEILKETHAITAVTSKGLPVYTAAALLFFALYLGCSGLFHALYRRHHIPGFEEKSS
ncbi:MAG: amino acid ABC transporter permease [Spartobacteria bacterium]|nr:amino acid ABC transporter permease [Spartobacteria bacterium]